MSEVLTNAVPSSQTKVQERRRPGRAANASPALVELMRRPTSASARARVALYDAPGFMPSADAARSAREPGFALRVGVAVLASGIAWAVAFKAMCVVWG